MKTKWQLKHNIKSKRGAALVEFAFALMLLLVLVFGMIEFGLIIKDHLSLAQIAREATRTAAVGNDDATVRASITSWATRLGLTNAVTSTITRTGSAPTGEVRVTLTYPHNTITSFLPMVPNPINLQATMVMRLE